MTGTKGALLPGFEDVNGDVVTEPRDDVSGFRRPWQKYYEKPPAVKPAEGYIYALPDQSSNASETFISHFLISICWGQTFSHLPQRMQSDALPCLEVYQP